MTAGETGAYVDAAAAVLRLPIAAAHRPGVIHYLELAAEMAALLDAVPLGPADDPAEAFVPIESRRAAS